MSPRSKIIHPQKNSCLNPKNLGLPIGTVKMLPEKFEKYFDEFLDCFATGTHNGYLHAYSYVLGLLSVDGNRNYVSISKAVNGVRDSGQNVQHFMSDSPWSGKKIFQKIQGQIAACPQLQGGFVTVDDTASARSVGISAGTARQRNGRLGKIDSCQCSVALTYQKDGISAQLDSELFLHSQWFSDEYRRLWPRLHIPEDSEYKTKVRIALEMIFRARRNGVNFTAVCGDDLYGHSCDFRQALDDNGIRYICDVPGNTCFFPEKPVLKYPRRCPGPPCPNYRKDKWVSGASWPVKELALRRGLRFKRVEIRSAERGVLCYDVAALKGWTVTNDGRALRETLLIRRESGGRYCYSFSNAPDEVSIAQLAQWRGHRYFVERTFQDCKSELGLDELRAVKYRAWTHHAALVALTLWLITRIRLEALERATRDGKALRIFDTDVLPPISVGCIRTLLSALFGLNQLAWREALYLVMTRQRNRIQSRKCRQRKQHARKKGKEAFG